MKWPTIYAMVICKSFCLFQISATTLVNPPRCQVFQSVFERARLADRVLFVSIKARFVLGQLQPLIELFQEPLLGLTEIQCENYMNPRKSSLFQIKDRSFNDRIDLPLWLAK